MSDQPGCPCSICNDKHHSASRDDIRTRIAAVLRLHQWRATVRMSDHDPALDCTCGMQFGPHHTFDCYREHVADAVIRALELTETGGVVVGCIHE